MWPKGAQNLKKFTYEDFAVSAGCHLNLRGVVKQVDSAGVMAHVIDMFNALQATPTVQHLADTHVQSVRFFRAKLSLQSSMKTSVELCTALHCVSSCRKRKCNSIDLHLPT